MKQLSLNRLIVFIFLILASTSFAQTSVKVSAISKKGNPIIFLPHIGCSSEMWDGIVKNYAENYACYLADFAGFNGLKPIDNLYTDNYVNDLRIFIKKEKLKNITLVGQNYGAFVAVTLASDKSLDIKAIIASDFYPKLSMVLDPAITAEKLEAMQNSIRKGLIEMNADAFAASQKQTAEMMNFNNTADVDRFVQWQQKSDRKTLAETLCEQLRGNLIPDLKDNKIPMLVFTTWYFAKKYKNMPISEADKKIKEMYGDTPNITHAVTEEAKDFIANDQPAWFIIEMDKFLKQHIVGK
ncbi:alpha/beta fold hydrolase [Flavobacterium aquicola]|uniref:Pimeloyl-ACP methyl ester carboxylesterase n=1 Tax=Flavobacterium aquicola TaxID=1682742 RepID=A0A3E0ENC3_9FLAO|nr:alpha/beta hydrolase [Flavobacterium aquicola]REG99754.1 pimeloyl-ACP methyl ester carboxylesterase [Flavobacterium aquicola]